MPSDRCPNAFVEDGDHVWVSIPASGSLASRPLLVCCHCREMRDGFDHRVIKPGEQPDAAPEMPRPPAEDEFDPELTARNANVDVFCAAHSEYSPYVCERRGCGHFADIHDPVCVCGCSVVLRTATEPANGTAQPGAGDTDTPGTGSGRGTGVAEASGTAQASGEEA